MVGVGTERSVDSLTVILPVPTHDRRGSSHTLVTAGIEDLVEKVVITGRKALNVGILVISRGEGDVLSCGECQR